MKGLFLIILMLGLISVSIPASAATETQAEFPVLEWKLMINSDDLGVLVPPLIRDSDGTLYTTTSSGFNLTTSKPLATLIAIDPSGKKKWEVKIGGNICTDLKFSPDGETIYVGTAGYGMKETSGGTQVKNGYFLYALDKNGRIKWSKEEEFWNDLAVGTDGTLYVGTQKGSSEDGIFAFRPDGSVKWHYIAGEMVCCGPKLDTMGNIYFATLRLFNEKPVRRSKLWCLAPDGSKKWVLDFSEEEFGFEILQNGLLYGSYISYPGCPPDIKGPFLINHDGVVTWEFSNFQDTDILVSDNGICMFKGNTVAIYDFSKNKVNEFTIPDDYKISFNKTYEYIVNNNIIFIERNDMQLRLFVFNSEGAVKTQCEIINQSPHWNTWALLPNGGIVLSNGTRLIYFDSDGRQAWDVAYNSGGIYGSSQRDGSFYLLEQTSGSIWLSSINCITFRDIQPSFWALEETQQLVFDGVLKGYPDGTFKPENPVTRAEFAKMALLSLGLKEEKPENPTFPDVPKDHWAYSYVEGAVKAGLIKGYPDGTFKPDGQVTKAEEMAVIVRGKKWEEGTPSEFHFSDCQADAWFAAYVETALAQGIVKIPDPNIVLENGAPKFDPNLPATRAQTAVFLARMREK